MKATKGEKPLIHKRRVIMTKFSHVIIRRPGKSLCNGITSAPELGQPIYERAIEEHYDYEHELSGAVSTSPSCPHSRSIRTVSLSRIPR